VERTAAMRRAALTTIIVAVTTTLSGPGSVVAQPSRAQPIESASCAEYLRDLKAIDMIPIDPSALRITLLRSGWLRGYAMGVAETYAVHATRATGTETPIDRLMDAFSVGAVLEGIKESCAARPQEFLHSVAMDVANVAGRALR